MKKIFIYIMLVIGMAGCQDQEIVFPDYDIKAVYFPFQTPVRTLSLGEDRIDNSLDRELKFDMGIAIGGMYKNKWEWTVDYVIDNSLLDNVVNNSGDTILPLPEKYYSLSPLNTMVIPSGKFHGRIRVQLNEDFLDDPIALAGGYVIPLRITGTSADSVLSGMPASGVENPDRRINTHWESDMAPKDWVLFGVKYVNAYHGDYLHRGMNVRYLDGTPVDTVVYKERYVENDQIWMLTNTSKDKVVTNGIAEKMTTTSANYAMELTFSNITGASGPITISPVAESDYAVTGTGEYFERAESVEGFIDLIFQSMYLDYTYNDGIYTHHVKDILTFRNRGIVFEQLSIEIN